MGDFEAFAYISKQHGMLADNITSPNRGEPNRPAVAFASDALSAINCTLIQIATQSFCNHLAHSQRGARWRVNLVAMVRFDNFNIYRVTEYLRSQF